MAQTGKYRLGPRLGGGGMAEVFRGTLLGAEGFSRPVAIKHMLADLSTEPDFEDMFRNEARIAAALHHPNIVGVMDFDRDEKDRLFLVMELVEGKDLRHLMKVQRPPVEISAYIIAKLLEALDYAHALELDGRPLHLVHRDVTPHNVLLSWDGHVKLSDFGIAKAAERTTVTKSGVVKGKVGYMSPEQIEGYDLDGRSDLFAVGIIFHELLTGQRLFGGDLPDRVVLNRILIAPVNPPHELVPDVPPEVSAVCMRLLERDLTKRYPTAQAALSALLDTDAVSPRGPLALRGLLKTLFPGEAPSGTFRSVDDPSVAGPDVALTALAPAPVPTPSAPSTGPLVPPPSAFPTIPLPTQQLPGASTRPMNLDVASDPLLPPVTRQRGLLVTTATLMLAAIGLSAALWWRQQPAEGFIEPAPVKAAAAPAPAPVVTPSAPLAEPLKEPKPAPTPEVAPAPAEPPKSTPRTRHASTRVRKTAPPEPERAASPPPAPAEPAAAASPPDAGQGKVKPRKPIGDDLLEPSFLQD